ncbi:MAG: hypothetical protein ACJAR3_001411 [Roseivirga sp.]
MGFLRDREVYETTPRCSPIMSYRDGNATEQVNTDTITVKIVLNN